MGDFSHLTNENEATMVDISAKVTTPRSSIVIGQVQVSQECLDKLDADAVLEIYRTARLAGIMAAKQTANLVPLCHQIPLTSVDLTVELSREQRRFFLQASTATRAATGVEMEAMTAATIAAVTVYDMIKAVDPAAIVGPFQLVEKHGGTSGSWKNLTAPPH